MKIMRNNVKIIILSFIIFLCILLLICFYANDHMNKTKNSSNKDIEVVYDTQLFSQEYGQLANSMIDNTD